MAAVLLEPGTNAANGTFSSVIAQTVTLENGRTARNIGDSGHAQSIVEAPLGPRGGLRV